jgi:RNA-directed DNA polymerase
VLEPIFEADLEPTAYGYRPGRSGIDAVKAVHRLLCQGFTDVVDADLSKYFDTIPHNDLLRSVAARIVDRHVLRLIKLWLKTPVEETDPEGRRRVSGGKHSTCGTPQGGVISPLLANRYMNRFLRHWRQQGCGERFRAQVVSYADDFVILSRGCAQEALAWTRRVMTKLGLSVNEAKTAVRDARRERFDFLGYSFGPHHYRKDGHWYLGASPSRKSVQQLKERVGDILVASNTAPWEEVCDRVNRLLRGWAEYFSYGTRLMAYRAADNFVYATVCNFLTRRHKLPSRGTRQFSDHQVFGELGVLRLRRLHIGAPPTGIR